MPNALIGRTVHAVYLANDKLALKFDTDKGELIANVGADCCSSTWIEDLDNPKALLGTILSIENIDMPDLGSPDSYDVRVYYGARITTTAGICIIDYRNESNGYYGGWIIWPWIESEDPYDYQPWNYTGVYHQTQSENQWKKIA